ncbi:MAG: hypothetical protein K6A38_03025 [Lachnospiraceae bacterium]|nr:hypothetical protein [Lachnospiraceae bacterium]
MKRLLIILCIAVVFLTGCSTNNEQIEKYRSDMDTILADIATVNSDINSLDPENESSMGMLLADLDRLDDLFKQMAQLEYPEGFDKVAKLASDASSDMSASVSRFHDAYDGEYNEVAQAEAYDLYQDANQKLRVLIQVLRGEYENPDASAPAEDAEEYIEEEVPLDANAYDEGVVEEEPAEEPAEEIPEE